MELAFGFRMMTGEDDGEVGAIVGAEVEVILIQEAGVEAEVGIGERLKEALFVELHDMIPRNINQRVCRVLVHHLHNSMSHTHLKSLLVT